MKNYLTLDGKKLKIEDACDVAFGKAIKLSKQSISRINKSNQKLNALIASDNLYYGVNTGFGSLSNVKVSYKQQKELQFNLLRSHACGHGDYLSEQESRLMLLLRLNVLARGKSGVSLKLAEKMAEFLNKKIAPAIPELGSVGASGDLVPLAHLGLSLIGEGFCLENGSAKETSKVLKKHKIKPHELGVKEGLSLVNGTEAMGALAVLASKSVRNLVCIADLAAALSSIGLYRFDTAFDSRIHNAKMHKGQRQSAKNILALINEQKNSVKLSKFKTLQNPYSYRCTPQVHGVVQDALAFFNQTVTNEINSVTDNPLVFTESNTILSGGNFHGQYLAFALDMLAIAISELGSISERRLEPLLNPVYREGLPAFLTKTPGVSSGFMATQYLASSLVNENKVLSHPASTDTIPSCGGIEDHVSMGMTSARKLKRIISNIETILAVEILAALQAIDLRELILSGKLAEIKKKVRGKVPVLKEDRSLTRDINLMKAMIVDGSLAELLGKKISL